MSERWTRRTVGDVADVIVSSVDKKTREDHVPVRLCNYTDVYRNDFIRPEMTLMTATATSNELQRFHLKVGDVLITKDSEDSSDIAVPAIVEATAPDLVCGYHLAIIRPGPQADGLFLKYFFDQPRTRAYFGSRANGAIRFGLTVRSIADAVVPMPPLSIQRTIAAILRTWDLGIARLHALENAHQRLIQGLRDHLLSPVLYSDKLGKEAWQTAKLRELGHFYSGLSGKSKADFFDDPDTGCASVPYTNVINHTQVDRLLLARVHIASGERQNLVRNGDILFTASSETPSEVGITSAFLCETEEPCYLNSFCYGFRLKNSDALLPNSQVRIALFSGAPRPSYDA